MHNIKSNFDKVFHTVKSLNIPEFNIDGNIRRPGMSPLFTDIEVISLVIVAEYMSLDSENWLFKKIKNDYKDDFPHIIDRTRFNRRKGQLFPFIEKVRQQLAAEFLEFEDYFIIDSMPLEVCKIAREKRSQVCRNLLRPLLTKGFALRKTFTFMDINCRGSVQLTGFSIRSN